MDEKHVRDGRKVMISRLGMFEYWGGRLKNDTQTQDEKEERGRKRKRLLERKIEKEKIRQM